MMDQLMAGAMSSSVAVLSMAVLSRLFKWARRKAASSAAASSAAAAGADGGGALAQYPQAVAYLATAIKAMGRPARRLLLERLSERCASADAFRKQCAA